MVYVNRRELTQAVQRACQVVRSAVRGFEQIRVALKQDSIELRSTNFEQSVVEVLPAFSDNGSAGVERCFPARDFLAVLKALPKSVDTVSLGVEGRFACIEQVQLGVGEDDVSELPGVPGAPKARIAVRADFSEAVQFVVAAVATERSRYTLNAVCLDFRHGVLLGSDGRRLHAAPLCEPFELDSVLVEPDVLELDEVSDILLPPDKGDNSSHIIFFIPNGYVAAVPMVGQYPDVWPLIRREHSTRCTVERAALLEALGQVRPVLDAENVGVDLAIGESLLLTPAHLKDDERWSLEVPAVVEGPAVHTCLDIHFLLDVARYLPAEHVTLNLTTPSAAVEIVSDTTDCWAYLMPITHASEEAAPTEAP